MVTGDERLGIVVVTCIKLAKKKRYRAAARIGAGEAVVMGSNPATSMRFLFLKNFRIFGGLIVLSPRPRPKEGGVWERD